MPLSILIKEKADRAYVADLKGSIDNETYLELQEHLHKVPYEKMRLLCLNMRRVDYLSSAGIGALITEKKSVESHRAVFAMAGLQPLVKKVLDLMKLSGLFVLLDDVPETEEQFENLLQRRAAIPPLGAKVT